jgi:hypothetical protein
MLNEHVGRWSWLGLAVLLAGCPQADHPQPSAADAGEPADAGEQTPPEPASEMPRVPRPSASDAGKGAPSRAADAGTQPVEDRDGPAGTPSMAAKDARFFVPTGQARNTSAPVVRSDRTGATHVLYPLYGAGGAYYAHCAAGCSRAQDITPVLLPTEGSVSNAALALTADGKPRVLLSTLLRVYYAQCDQHCGELSGWSIAVIDDHQGVRDATGQALALDPQGRPRFVEHTYLAYLGVGQKPPATWYMQCDEADCTRSESWKRDQISDKIWSASQLQYSADGRAHLLTAVENADGMSAGLMLGCRASRRLVIHRRRALALSARWIA